MNAGHKEYILRENAAKEVSIEDMIRSASPEALEIVEKELESGASASLATGSAQTLTVPAAPRLRAAASRAFVTVDATFRVNPIRVSAR